MKYIGVDKGSHYEVTTETNYNAYIMDARKVMRFPKGENDDFFKSINEVDAYASKFLGINNIEWRA